MCDAELEQAFGAFDADGSGKVDRKELKSILNKLVEMEGCPFKAEDVEPFCQFFMDEGDADNDGTLSKGEFMKLMKKFNSNK